MELICSKLAFIFLTRNLQIYNLQNICFELMLSIFLSNKNTSETFNFIQFYFTLIENSMCVFNHTQRIFFKSNGRNPNVNYRGNWSVSSNRIRDLNPETWSKSFSTNAVA